MNKILIRSALFLSIASGAVTAQAITITWNDNLNPLPVYPGTLANNFPGGSATTIPFKAGNEFRIVALDSITLASGHKDVFFGGEQWVFDNGTGQLTDVIGTEMTPGAQSVAGSAAPGGSVGLFQNAPFATMPFGFVAPTLGSSAGNAYGVGALTETVDGFDILFPVLEAQWGGTYFTLGSSSGGITFNCDVTGIDVTCIGEHIIQASEDIGVAGFSQFKPQWELHGTVSTVPVPAAVWLFGSGLMGLIAIARRKISV